MSTALLHPEWMAPAGMALGLLALVVMATAWRARRRSRALVGDARLATAAELARDLALLAALALIGVALLGPRLGTRTELVDAHGVDAILLLDVSRSMEAADVPPSRLARARRAAEQVLAGLAAGDRAALAVFAGRGVLLTPLTPDRDALLEMLPAVDASLLQDQGSRLGAGVGAALAGFEPESERPRLLLVLSDGEDPERAAGLGGGEAARAGVRVLAVALGSERGATLPDGDVPLRDRSGRVVVSRREIPRLARLADATGGRVFAADRWGRVDADAVLAELRRDAPKAPGETVARRSPAYRVAPFAAAALGLLLLELGGLGPIGSRRRRRGGVAVALAGLLGIAAGAPGSQPDPRRLLRVGIERAQAGLLPAAADALLGAALTARDPQLAALAYYDLGVVELGAGRLEQARDAFLDALVLAPDDFEARFNLEWTLRALRERPPPSGAASGDEEPRDAPPPETTPEARPEPQPSERPEAAGRTRAEPAPLAPDEVQRWIESVPDDAAASLRRATRGSGEAPSAGPRW